MGAAALWSPGRGAAQSAPSATVLYDGRVVTLDGTAADSANGALWIDKSDLPRINDFELKAQGACRADVCIPIPPAMTSGTRFNLTGFAQRVGQRVVAVPASRVWSFGEIPVV